VPSALYFKRVHENNVHASWYAWPRERRVRAWVVHCADMFAEAMQVTKDPPVQRLLLDAARLRLLFGGRAINPFPDITNSTLEERAQMLADFNAIVRARVNLAEPVPA
jgi:hypothetical protein